MDCMVEADHGFRLFGRKIAVPPGNPKESSPEILLVKETIGEAGRRTPSVSVNGSEEDQQTPSKKTSNPLPCPRCSSTETKFCYFNNYNVNQPRHFCKKCQRYWTAGGSLRNVPVGAGRRKSKSPSLLQYREMDISDRHLLFPYDVRFRQPGCGPGAGVRKHAMEEAAEGCVFFPKAVRMEGPCKSPSTHHHHFSC